MNDQELFRKKSTAPDFGLVIEKVQICEIPERKLSGTWTIERPQTPTLQAWYDANTWDKRLPRKRKKQLKKQFEAGQYSFLKDFGFMITFHGIEAEEELKNICGVLHS